MVVLRAPLGPSVRARYHCASALSFWNLRNRQASWISPRRTRAIAGLGQPFLAPLGSALVGRAGEAGVARHGPSVAEVPRQHLLHQHVRRLDPDADDAGQQTHHRVRAPVRRLFQSCSRVCSIASICARTTASRAMSRRISVERVRRDRHTLRRAQCVEPLRRFAQRRLEAADAEPGQRRLSSG